MQISVTVAVEMTAAQRDAYSKYFGNEFVTEEVANRLRPEVQRALFGEARSVWLDWLTGHATVTVTRMERVAHANPPPPGVRLRQERERLGWSLREAERRTGVPNAHISQIETGAIKSPELATLAPLAAAYRLSLDELATEEA